MAVPHKKDSKGLWLEADWMRCADAGAAWAPAVDILRFETRIEICFDLAGIPMEHVKLEVEACELRILGQRPAPKRSVEAAQRLVQMEIPHGPFARRLSLPCEVSPAHMHTHYQDGMLWVVLPLV